MARSVRAEIRAHRSMSLAQHLASGQLPLFMTAGEIKEHYNLGDLGGAFVDSPEQVREFKNRPVGVAKTPEHKAADERLLNRKLSEANTNLAEDAHGYYTFAGTSKGLTLSESIQAEGIKTPLTITHWLAARPAVADGHHRLAAMAAYRPDDMIPLRHTTDLF